ncbi:MAG: hypothetical protein WAM85_19985 [Terracidiphilus sp.]
MKTLILIAMLLGAQSARAQDSFPRQDDAAPLIRSTSTLVTVPAVVRLPTGEFEGSLNADQFQLFDNGSRQTVAEENAENLPIALVVLMQTGGAGAREFQNYMNLPITLDRIIGKSTHEITLVTFDGQPRAIWHFPARSDGVVWALTHPHAGGQGAAIMDAVSFAVDQLQQEPGRFRRIVLLLSQTEDEGSTSSPAEVIRKLGQGSTAVYSLTFPSTKSGSKHRSTRSGSAEPDHLSASFAAAVRAMGKNTAAEIALLSGGEHAGFTNEREFNSDILYLADEIRNRYELAFQPNSHEPGFHALSIQVDGQKGRLDVRGRSSYWFDATPRSGNGSVPPQ